MCPLEASQSPAHGRRRSTRRRSRSRSPVAVTPPTLGVFSAVRSLRTASTPRPRQDRTHVPMVRRVHIRALGTPLSRGHLVLMRMRMGLVPHTASLGNGDISDKPVRRHAAHIGPYQLRGKHPITLTRSWLECAPNRRLSRAGRAALSGGDAVSDVGGFWGVDHSYDLQLDPLRQYFK